VTKILKNILHL